MLARHGGRDPAQRSSACPRHQEVGGPNGHAALQRLDPAYEDRIRRAYPIHPELFDRLYQDWSTLERFQRTGGVLRLMSTVVHALWGAQDAAPMILPGTVPLDLPTVVSEITQYLPDAWKPIIDRDVDGAASTPARIDAERSTFGQRAVTRRLARSIFIGAAPAAILDGTCRRADES